MVEFVAAVQQALQARAAGRSRPAQPALGGAGEPVELGEEVAQNPNRLVLTVMRQERAGQALQVLDPVPVR